MSNVKINASCAVLLVVFVSLACGRFGRNEQPNTGDSINATLPNTNRRAAQTPTTADEAASTSGEERQKPAAGKGNVQGKVLFNDEPVEGIEVRICENFSTILGIKCDGKTKTVKTGADGVFVIADLDPMNYGGLTAKVFKSDYYLYPYEGFSSMIAKRFNVEADKTIFANDINLFKDDLKITQPKAGAKIPAENVEIKWDEYPNADYYKISLYPDIGGDLPVNNERVDDPVYALPEPLANGKYRIKIEAFNLNNRKLAETGSDIKFNVAGGADLAPKP